MSYTDARGHTVPAGTDPASRQSLLDLSLSIPSVHGVTSAAAATRYVEALAEAGVPASATHPAVVRRADTDAISVYDGSSWSHYPAEAVGTADWYAGAGGDVVAPNTWYPATWAGAKVIRTGGITWSAGDGFRVTSPGRYQVNAMVKFKDIPSASTGYVGVGIAIDGNMHGHTSDMSSPSGSTWGTASLAITVSLVGGQSVGFRHRQGIGTGVKRNAIHFSVIRVSASA